MVGSLNAWEGKDVEEMLDVQVGVGMMVEQQGVGMKGQDESVLFFGPF